MTEKQGGFNINTAEVHEETNSNKYYIIPAGTIIYRGSDSRVDDISPDRPPPFFGFIHEEVKKYGNFLHTYEFNKRSKLLAIMEMDKKSDFFIKAPNNIKTILNNNFGYNDESKKIRYSTPINDKTVMQYLCELKEKGESNEYKNYDGYAMDGKKKTDTNSNFHAELIICYDSLNKIRLINTIDQFIPPRIERSKKRGRLERADTHISPFKFNLDSNFDYDSPDEKAGGRIRFKKKDKRMKNKSKRMIKYKTKKKKTRKTQRR